MNRINYREVLREARNNKFSRLRDKTTIHCAYHQSEGCGDCIYQLRCVITGGKRV